MDERRQHEQGPGDASSGSSAGARFEPVPPARSRGRIELSSSRNAELVSLAAAASLAVVSSVVVAASEVVLPLWAWLPLVMLATAIWALPARTRRAELSWDDWGLTLDERGARIAIAWSAARAHVGRERHRTTVEVRDDEGRVIAVHDGAPRGLSAEPRRAIDISSLLAAIAELPRDVAPQKKSVPAVRPRAVLAFLGLAALTASFALAQRPLEGAATAALGALAVGALGEAASAWARARTLRGARTIHIAGTAGGLLRATVDGDPVTLRVIEPLADARAGERDEPVRVVLGSEAGSEASPYRAARLVPVRALEAMGEAHLRRRRLASGLGRFVTGAAAIASWAVLVPAAPPPPGAAGARAISTLDGRPEPPRPRPIAPRPPGDREEADRAVEAWRRSGPHFEHTYQCTARAGCRRVPVYVDPRSNTRIVCDDENVEECMRLRRTGGLPLASPG